MKTFSDFETLSLAEQKLLKACVSGDFAIISETRPTEPTVTNTVRAAFIRWLALGGNSEYPLHAQGVQLQGAWISDELDLKGAVINTDLTLDLCHISKNPDMIGVVLSGSLGLRGCLLADGLDADRAQIAGSVFLCSLKNTNFESVGEIRFLNASIGGSLNCVGAKMQSIGERPYVLNADGAKINGEVFLRSNKKNRFEAIGGIRLVGAIIGGDLSCSDAEIRVAHSQVAFSADRAQISGAAFFRNNFECTGAIHLIGATVRGGLTLENLQKPLDSFDVSHAKIGLLQSEMKAWGSLIVLDGFVYDSFRGANWHTKEYLKWLNKQSSNHNGTKNEPQFFKPQPWQQLISVLRKMGHNDEARDIAIAFEKRRYDIGKITGSARPLHWLFGELAGYGYKPLRLVGYMLTMWLFFGYFYWWAALAGVFTPSDPLVFQNATYDTCRSVDLDSKSRTINNEEPNGKTNNWYTCGKLMGEYTTFSPLTYSLDVILPLVDLGQEKSWGTYIDTAKPIAVTELIAFTPNHIIRLMVWFEILFGWMASLMLVAVLTGLTDRNKS